MTTMFCYQCEQTASGGCTQVGVCGKDAETAALQDLLLHATKGISQYANRLRALGVRDLEADRFTLETLFTTVTNVNFDAQTVADMVLKAAATRDRLAARYAAVAPGGASAPQGPAAWQPAGGMEALVRQGEAFSIAARREALGDDIAGLQELLTYGLKGMAAYAHHAQDLGQESDEVYVFTHRALAYLAEGIPAVDTLVGLALECGKVNVQVMGMLDAANTGAYGHPVPTAVRVEPVKGKAILISGHDLKDLEELLKQTEGKGINVYTHGEMLPAHGYPKLKAYPHLVGNYGSAWQNQRQEFEQFPGAILMTTNCIQRPRESYVNRIFTSGLVQWPGVRHIANRDFTPVIEAALAADGFAADGGDKTILVGFGHEAVLGVAGKVIDAVKAGAIRHFFLIGGCDGADSARNYYTELAEAVPQDCVILTLACGKYRFNHLEFGDIQGIPRMLDIGQCNDAYSAVVVAQALAQAFGTDVNGLPLSLVLSWYEQKAVAILLSLLHLGVKNIRLGPSLPAFVTPPVLQVLVDNFNLAPIGTPASDLAAILS